MKTVIFAFLCFFMAFQANAKTVKYELIVSRQSINVSGKKNVDFALVINNQLPAPTLEFTEGDDAEIKLINGHKDD